jgi:hypothetical protein
VLTRRPAPRLAALLALAALTGCGDATPPGSSIEDNHAIEGGGVVFFVSNNRTGTMVIEGSTLRRNRSDGFETRGLRGIFFLGARNPTVTGSVIQ